MLSAFKSRVNTDDMISHGLLMVVFGILAGFLTYLYQLLMGNLLPQNDYGILVSFTSILLIVTVMSQAITVSIARYTSRLKPQERLTGANYIWRWSLKRVMYGGLAAFVLVMAFSPLISWFLRVDSVFYSVIISLAMVIMLVLSVNWGVMQGLERFLFLGSSQALLELLKSAIAALLVYAGLGICGGLISIPISFVVVVLITSLFIWRTCSTGSQPVVITGLISYTGLALLALFSMTVLVNVDVILGRHYLGEDDAGSYAALSVLGRIAFYAPVGVATAMFPKVSQRFESGRGVKGLFLRAAILTVLIAGGVLLVYAVVPHVVTGLLFSGRYSAVAAHLPMYGLAMALLAVSYLIMAYLLSVGDTKVAYVLLSSMALQCILTALFHRSIEQMVMVRVICSGVCLLSMLPLCFVSRERQIPNEKREA